MTTSLSPSKIAKFQEMLGAALRKSDGLFDLEAQAMIENDWNDLQPELEKACVTAINKIRKRNKRNTIVRHVRVNRTLTARQSIDATGRRKYVDQAVVDGMPIGGPEEVEMVYVRYSHHLSPAELDHEFKTGRLKDLIPDPQAQAADNAADQSFADQHSNGTQWGFDGQTACYATFSRWTGERKVCVHRNGRDWYGPWWFGGRRK